MKIWHALIFTMIAGVASAQLPFDVKDSDTSENFLFLDRRQRELDAKIRLQKISLVSATPPAAECDSDNDVGKQRIDTSTNRLYVCAGASRGWDFTALTD